MGYYGNGFVLTQSPQWEQLATSFPDSLSLRGYAHRSQPIWLLDAWVPSRHEHWPFTHRLPKGPILGSELPALTTDLLELLRRVYSSLAPVEQDYGLGYVEGAARLSVAGGQRTFFFAADDDLVDMAVAATAGLVDTLQIRHETCSVEFSGGSLRLIPFRYSESEEDDAEFGIPPAILREIATVSGLSVEPSRTIDGGAPFYGSAVELWPWGDPTRLLGIGTWDPFLNLDRDFRTVFERVAVAPPKASQ